LGVGATQQILFTVGSVNFISPRYYTRGMRGVLCANFAPPHQALAFACTQMGNSAIAGQPVSPASALPDGGGTMG